MGVMQNADTPQTHSWWLESRIPALNGRNRMAPTCLGL